MHRARDRAALDPAIRRFASAWELPPRGNVRDIVQLRFLGQIVCEESAVRLGSRNLTRQNGDAGFLSRAACANSYTAGTIQVFLADSHVRSASGETASLQCRRRRFAKEEAVLLRKSSEMGDAKTCRDVRDGAAVGPPEQVLPHGGQAQPPPELERGNAHERAKMLAQCSFGDTAMGDEVGYRDLPAQVRPDAVNRLLEIVRDRLASRYPTAIEIIR